MEKQIAEIFKEYGLDEKVLCLCIHEISELFKGMYPEGFVIWLTQKLRLNELIFIWDTNKYYMYDNDDKEFVLYGLYQYWIEKIKDK